MQPTSWCIARATSSRLRCALLLRPPISASPHTPLPPPSPAPVRRRSYLARFPPAHLSGGARGMFRPRVDPREPEAVPYLAQREPLEIREDLTGPLGFTVDQLTELEGLSVASAIAEVRVEGTVEKVPEEESDRYFHSRPRGSQIGALVSMQSSVIDGRHVIHQAHMELQEKHSNGRHPSEIGKRVILLLQIRRTMVPKPEMWGGFRLKPKLLEFWQGQPSRLHDRIQYTLEEIGRRVWHINRLAP